MSARKRIAHALTEHAARSLPQERRDWAEAMRAELDHVAPDRLITWGLGCVTASYIERTRIMIRGNLIIPKWLLAIETSVFLFPATLIWLVAILHLRALASQPAIVFGTFTLTIAPINLWMAFRFIATRRPLRYRFHLVSAFLFAVYAIAQILGLRYTGQGPSFAWFQFDWRLVLLLSILPALCAWHLSIFARTPENTARIA